MSKQWKVRSSSQRGVSYVVRQYGKKWFCDCMGFKCHKHCKHIAGMKERVA